MLGMVGGEGQLGSTSEKNPKSNAKRIITL